MKLDPNFRLESSNTSDAAVAEAANAIERAVGEAIAGLRKPGSLPVEPIAQLVQYARNQMGLEAELRAQLAAERDQTRELQNRILLAIGVEAEFHNGAYEDGPEELMGDVMGALGAHVGPSNWHAVAPTMHPLPLGMLVLSAEGECDSDEHDEDRETGSYAVGQIVSADRHKYEGWSYGVVFGNGTWVHIDEAELADPDAYLVANAVF